MRGSVLLRSAAALLLLASAVHAEPNELDFTADGFEAGSLNGQNGWLVKAQAPANGDFVFTPGKGLVLTPNTAGTHASAFACMNDSSTPFGRDTFTAGTPLSTTINLVIKQEPGPKKGPIVGLGWGLFVPVGPNSLPFFLELARDTNEGGYRLRLAKISEKTKVEGEPILMIPEAALGFEEGDMESDPLQLSFTVTNEGDKADWTTIGMLTNLTTKKVFVLKNTIVAPGVYKTDNFIRGIINSRRGVEDGLSSVVITKLDAEPTPDPISQ